MVDTTAVESISRIAARLRRHTRNLKSSSRSKVPVSAASDRRPKLGVKQAFRTECPKLEAVRSCMAASFDGKF